MVIFGVFAVLAFQATTRMIRDRDWVASKVESEHHVPKRRSETRHAHSAPVIRSNSASSITAMPRALAFSSLLPASAPART